MDREIVRVWGTADGCDLLYVKGRDGRWRADVPADLSDGMYVCEIHAVNSVGYEAYWAGVLYMNKGKACIHLNKNRYTVWTGADTVVEEVHEITLLCEIKSTIVFTKMRDTILILENDCCCGIDRRCAK